MTGNEDFINMLLAKLDSRGVSNEDLKKIKLELNVMLNNYEISPRETHLIIAENYLPPCYSIFMIAKKMEGRTESTLKQYKFQLDGFFNYVQKPIEEIKKEDVILYLYQLGQNGRSGKPCSPVTVDNTRSCLNSFFSWANSNGYIRINPCSTIEKIKGEEKLREPFSELEIEIIRNAISHYKINQDSTINNYIRIRDMALFEFLFSTGCRVGEVEKINRVDINTSVTPAEVTVFGKGKKYRKTYLNAKAVYYLNQYLEIRTDNNPALFVSCRAPFDRLKVAGIQTTFKKYEEITNIRIYPHRIRHTTATQGLKHGMPIPDLQALLGHSKPETTMIYAHLANEEIKYAHTKYIN